MRRLPPETERDLHDAGLFRIVQPKRVGGSELDYVALVDCADALGQADASVAWNFANLASHHWMLGMFDRRAQDVVWNKDAERADSIVLHLSGRPRQKGRRRICAARPLAVLLGRGVPANGICLPASFRPTMRPTGSSTGYSCSTRASTRSTTPGMRPACAARDRTMSRSRIPLLPEQMTVAVSDLDRWADTRKRRQSKCALCVAGVLAVSLCACRASAWAMRRPV